MDQTWVSGHLYHLQPTTGCVAFLKRALLLTVTGICELSPLAHMAAHVLSRALVGELRARTAGCPAPPSTTPLPFVVQRELHAEWQVKARGSAILYFTFNRRYTETRDSLRDPGCAHSQAS